VTEKGGNARIHDGKTLRASGLERFCALDPGLMKSGGTFAGGPEGGGGTNSVDPQERRKAERKRRQRRRGFIQIGVIIGV